MPEILGIQDVYARTERAISEGNNDLADRLIWPAIDQFPDDPVLWFLAGNVAWKREHNSQALMFYQRCEELGGGVNPSLYTNMGAVYRRLNRQADAIGTLTKATVLDPGNPVAHVNLCSAYVNEGDPDSGIAHGRRAMELDPNSQKTQWNLGLLLLEKGEFDEGFRMYRTGLSSGERMMRRYTNDADEDSKLLDDTGWERTRMRQRRNEDKPTLIVWGEQGIGDELMFATCLNDAAKLFDIILECHPRLATFFEAAKKAGKLNVKEIHPTRKDEYINWTMALRYDYKCAIGDLPVWLRKTEAQFPEFPAYADPVRNHAYLDYLKARYGDRPIIGIANAGGSPKTMRGYRSIDGEQLAKRLPKEPIYVSLEYMPMMGHQMRDQLEAAGLTYDYPEALLTHFDYQHTASLLRSCDQILTVNTSVVHLAGACGIQTKVLTPKRPAWRYGVRDAGVDQMYWYRGTHTQYRQQRDGVWDEPLEAALSDLRKELEL